ARKTLQAAIKAHGGEDNIAKTLTGKAVAKARLWFLPDLESSVSWEETFELPRRYHRSIKSEMNGKKLKMEYGISDGNGWIRRGEGEPEDFKCEKLPLSRRWNAVLAILPMCLDDKAKLERSSDEIVMGQKARV